MKTFLFILLFFLGIYNWVFAASDYHRPVKLPHDGLIRLYVYHVDEVEEIRYLDENGQWIDSAYEKINKMVRSRGDSEEIKMDKRLIELADHLQDHFKVDQIEIISGYRSSAFNKSLKDAGRNVANESLHTKGMAMDIHIDEINEATVRDYLTSLKMGGVGYYGNVLMVHMDFGPIRQWHSGNYRDNTEIGIFHEESPIVIKTDKLFYKLDSKMKMSYTGITGDVALVLEKFSRGKWVSVARVNLKRLGEGAIPKGPLRGWRGGEGKKIIVLKDILKDIQILSPFGKFRFHYKGKNDWQNSNEFYVKKK